MNMRENPSKPADRFTILVKLERVASDLSEHSTVALGDSKQTELHQTIFLSLLIRSCKVARSYSICPHVPTQSYYITITHHISICAWQMNQITMFKQTHRGRLESGTKANKYLEVSIIIVKICWFS